MTRRIPVCPCLPPFTITTEVLNISYDLHKEGTYPAALSVLQVEAGVRNMAQKMHGY